MERITRFLRLPAVIEMVGLQRTAIYGLIKAGTFPAPVQLGPRAVAWSEADIANWQAELKTGVKSSGDLLEGEPAHKVLRRNAAIYSPDHLAYLEAAIDVLRKEVSDLRQQIEVLQKGTK